MVYNCHNNKNYIYSYSQLKSLKNNLFNGTGKTPIAIALKEALPDCNLVFVDDRVTKILNKVSSFIKIPKCDFKSCLKLLATKPNLDEPDKRINLLKELVK